MKIVVTGAGGFVGRHVVAELERRSISPVLLLRPGTKPSAALSKHCTLSVDIKDPSAAFLDKAGAYDTLIHLAWGGLPNYTSVHHFEEELPAHYRFIRLMVKAGIRNLVVTGTCFEYGMRSGPLKEDLDVQPANAYGFSKDALRRQLEYLQQTSAFNLTWTRLFYLFGEGQSENSLLPQLKKAVERGERIFNMSGGEQLRDYLEISEAVKYLVSLSLTERNNGIVNVCSGAPISVRRLIEQWIREHGLNMQLNLGYYPYPAYEPMAFWGDRIKLDRCLGLTP